MKTIEVMDNHDTYEFIKHYLCSTCWGRLMVVNIEEKGMKGVQCANPDCSGLGFVTNSYVDRRRNEDRANYTEAWFNLRNILNLRSEFNLSKSEEEIINSLFGRA